MADWGLSDEFFTAPLGINHQRRNKSKDTLHIDNSAGMHHPALFRLGAQQTAGVWLSVVMRRDRSCAG